MQTLPANLVKNNRTPDFDQDSVPAGILSHHTLAEDVWGVINVTEGSLTYQILEPEIEEHQLDASHKGIVSPQTGHQVVVNGPVKFHIQFMKKED